MTEPTDTNQASEDELDKILVDYASKYFQLLRTGAPRELEAKIRKEAKTAIQSAIRTEKLKLLDKFENDCKYNYTTFGNSEKMLQVSGLLKRIEAERTKLEAEL